ncbi:Hypothetical protein CINCED_3A003943 [Cinara cedri]|uniref:Uncharacterized protein n=1 Tax=Cinara cedri TaxID=506608 RepID=A0A5E4NGN4_9HEMI|nr:Hypothetical protein CINCED_3A003943 [Cinara cedri]
MNFYALKLLFYTFVVHAIVPDNPNKIKTMVRLPKNNSEFNLIVETFQKPNNLITVAKTIVQGEFDIFRNLPTQFITFELELVLIFRQMAYAFEKRNETELKDFIGTVCTMLPRCLDFTYIGVLLNSITIMLSEIHIILCHELPTYYKEYENATADIEKKLINEKIDRILISIQSMIEKKTNIGTNLFEEVQNYEDKSMGFISVAYVILGYNNIIPYMNLIHGLEEKDMFESYSQTNKMQFKVSEIRTGDNEIQRNSEKPIHFQEINNDYAKKLQKEECGLIQFVDDFSTAEAMEKLLLFTLSRLQQYCTHSMLNDIKDVKDDKEEYDNMDDNDDNDDIDDSGHIEELQSETENKQKTNYIIDMLKGMCQNIPLILMYLKEITLNNVNKFNDDSIMFSMYLTFCSDFKGYTDIRCANPFPNTEVKKKVFEAKLNDCVSESVKNIWSWNLFKSTHQVPKMTNEHFVNNELCTKLYLNYLTDIYDTIKQFYTGKTMGVWTTFEWLSGKYFLTENSENVDMNELKSKDITIRDVTMSLSVAYHAILPWGLNTFSVMEFHKTIVYHLDRTMKTYVYRYAQIIFMYLNRTSSSDSFQVLQNIRDSVRWYIDGTELFYKYLDLPLYTDTDAQNEPQPTNRIDSLISMIKNIYNNGSINVDEYIPPDEKKDFSQWSETKLPEIDDGYEQFNMVINSNCMDAMNYMSAFFSIAKKSMDINFEFHSAATMYSQYCPQNIFCVSESVFKLEITE